MGLLSSTDMFGCVPSGVPLWRYSVSFPSNRWRKERWLGLGVHIQANFWWKLSSVNSAKCTKLLKYFQLTVDDGGGCNVSVWNNCWIPQCSWEELKKKDMLDHVCMSNMNTVNSNQWCILCYVTSDQPVCVCSLFHSNRMRALPFKCNETGPGWLTCSTVKKIKKINKGSSCWEQAGRTLGHENFMQLDGRWNE